LDGSDLNSDLDWQESTTSLSVNWKGFAHKLNKELGFEWCVISQKQASNDFKLASGECRSQKGFSGEPDTFPWTLIQTNTENEDQKLSIDSLPLEPGQVYYAVLHVFPLKSEHSTILSKSNENETETETETTNDDNEEIFINTNGTLILPLVGEDLIEDIYSNENQDRNDDKTNREEKELDEKKQMKRRERDR